MYIARIICTNRSLFDELEKYIEVVEFTDNIRITNDVPTLIVSKKLAEKLYGKENVKVLNKTICENIFWTYSKMENRLQFENEIKNFRDNVTKSIFEKIHYVNFSIFIEPLHRIKDFIRFLNNSTKKYIFLENDQLYIYASNNKVSSIVGLSLLDCEYIGIDKKKILTKINSNKNNILFTRKHIIDYNLKQITNEKKYIIPYLYSLFE